MFFCKIFIRSLVVSHCRIQPTRLKFALSHSLKNLYRVFYLILLSPLSLIYFPLISLKKGRRPSRIFFSFFSKLQHNTGQMMVSGRHGCVWVPRTSVPIDSVVCLIHDTICSSSNSCFPIKHARYNYRFLTLLYNFSCEFYCTTKFVVERTMLFTPFALKIDKIHFVHMFVYVFRIARWQYLRKCSRPLLVVFSSSWVWRVTGSYPGLRSYFNAKLTKVVRLLLLFLKRVSSFSKLDVYM